MSYKINTAVTLRSRVEMLWYDHNNDNKANAKKGSWFF
jgi:hypothetical protein